MMSYPSQQIFIDMVWYTEISKPRKYMIRVLVLILVLCRFGSNRFRYLIFIHFNHCYFRYECVKNISFFILTSRNRWSICIHIKLLILHHLDITKWVINWRWSKIINDRFKERHYMSSKIIISYPSRPILFMNIC